MRIGLSEAPSSARRVWLAPFATAMAAAGCFGSAVLAADDPGYRIIMSPEPRGPGYVIVKPDGRQAGDPQFIITDPARTRPAIWSGPYIGAEFGYGWQRGKITDFLGFSVRPEPRDWLVGAFAGYNRQLDNVPVVLGAEVDAAWANFDGKGTLVATGKLGSNWSGAVRGRVGVVFDRILVYAAGGAAASDRKTQFSVTDARFSDTKTAIGWTLGGGADVALLDNVFLRAEYRHTDYGSKTFQLAGAPFRTQLEESRALAGLAYKFGW